MDRKKYMKQKKDNEVNGYDLLIYHSLVAQNWDVILYVKLNTEISLHHYVVPIKHTRQKYVYTWTEQ